MMTFDAPKLETSRLRLRLLEICDAPRVTELAGDGMVYETTLAIPHPYTEQMAKMWISSSVAQFYAGNGVDLAVTLKESGELIGAVGLVDCTQHRRAELGYWIGGSYLRRQGKQERLNAG